MRIKLLLIIQMVATLRVMAQVPAADNQTGNANYNMNWTLAWTYDAFGNTLASSKVFFDISGRVLQNQTKVNYRSNASTTYTHVMAAQPIRDVEGREVLSTVTAPIDYADFNYMPNFVPATDGTNYTYKNFDRFNPSGSETDLTNSPQAVGGQSTKGTLGWYYGSNNTWEPYTATSNYPYTRYGIFKDGTNGTKKQGGLGEAYVMGSGHETSRFVTPVSGELGNYLAVRDAFLSSSQVGQLPTNLQNGAMQVVNIDNNGNREVSIFDAGSHLLMQGRPGTDLVYTNTVGVGFVPSPTNYVYQVTTQVATSLSIGVFQGGLNVSIYWLAANGSITSVYTGPASGVPINTTISGSGVLHFESDQSFFVQINASSQYSYNSTAFSGPGYPTVGYFYVLADNTAVTVSGNYTIYSMTTEAPTSLNAQGQLNHGYYRVVANTGFVNLSYSNGLTDVNYAFWDGLGRAVASIPPNGVKLLEGNGYQSYSTLAQIPFVSTLTHDPQNRLLSTSTPDEGTKNFVYRMDGGLRFSQNAYQATTGSFSFSNFDQYGRLIQSGVYTPGSGGVTFGSSAMKAILETTGLWGGLTNGTMTDVTQNNYDLPDNTYNVASNVSTYVQDPNYLGNAISTSMRYSSIVNNTPAAANLVSQSWYNYDNQGKVIWQIKYIPALGLNGYKSTDNTYDALSRKIKTIFQAKVAAETFVQYYQYDAANGTLYQVYAATSDVGVSNATLQATYIYYLHGGLKRVQLGTNIQGIDFTYTLQGKLKAINNSNNASTADDPGGDAVAANGFNPDVFGEVLDYYPGDYNNTRTTGIAPINGVNTSAIVGAESYGGNIKAMSWYSIKPSGLGGSNAATAYVYNYDPKYQLIASTWGTGLNFATVPAGITATSSNREVIVVPGTGTLGTTSPGTSAYDPNGNILDLARTNAAGTLSDIFAYGYKPGTNQLSALTNTGSSGDSYVFTYDQIGRETSETFPSSPNNKYIRYDAMGNVTLVARDAGFTQPLAGFVYDEEGNRIEKLTYNTSYQLSQVTYYYGEAVYTQTVTNGTYGPLTPIEYALVGKAGGRIGIYAKQSSLYLYELRDHLGNVRAIVGATGAVQTATDYYPYGMVIATLGTPYRYQYQGQSSEADPETRWNYFQLRMYNSRLGRWETIDAKHASVSPYSAMNNNPANYDDPDGGCPECDADAFLDAHGGSDNATKYAGTTPGVWHVNVNKGTYIGTYTFVGDPNDVPTHWYSGIVDKWNDVSNWFSESHFVEEATVKVTYGAQIGIHSKLYDGAVDVDAEAGYHVRQLTSATLSSEANKTDGSHLSSTFGDDHKESNFAGIGVTSPLAHFGVAAKYEDEFTYVNTEYGPPVYGESTPKVTWALGFASSEDASSVLSSHVSADAKVESSDKGTFFGIDVSGKVALFLGIEGGVKIGFYHP